ncbi:MAG: carboxypeptidase-like regulatory domain-containing protein [Marinilabiliaceae bacterium]|nr:carboxypeptidase-like regulatory domain-containing protein [Marinilabiliaceae bacterium]
MNRIFIAGATLMATLLAASFTNECKAQYQLIKGKVVANESPVEFAYIINKRTQTATETQEEGLFKMETNLGDTLHFRCLGYKDTTFVVDAQTAAMMVPIFDVQQQSYVLGEVEVRWFYSYAAFKHAFKNLKLDDKNKSFKYDIPINKSELMAASKLNSGTSGITFTPGGKYLTQEQKKANAIKDYENKMERYNRLVSHDNIQSFTGLTGKSLDSFIVYLRSRKNINPDWDDYNIMLCVKAAYENYLAMNESDIKDTIQ